MCRDSLGPGLDQQVLPELDGKRRHRPPHPAEIPAGHVVAHPIVNRLEAPQLDRTLEARGIERVIDAPILRDGVSLGTVSAQSSAVYRMTIGYVVSGQLTHRQWSYCNKLLPISY